VYTLTVKGNKHTREKPETGDPFEHLRNLCFTRCGNNEL